MCKSNENEIENPFSANDSVLNNDNVVHIGCFCILGFIFYMYSTIVEPDYENDDWV